MAQSGSVFALEARGHRFKSCHPDQMKEALIRLMERWDSDDVRAWGYDAHKTIQGLLQRKNEEDARSPCPLEIYAEQVQKEEND